MWIILLFSYFCAYPYSSLKQINFNLRTIFKQWVEDTYYMTWPLFSLQPRNRSCQPLPNSALMPITKTFPLSIFHWFILKLRGQVSVFFLFLFLWWKAKSQSSIVEKNKNIFMQNCLQEFGMKKILN